MPSAQRGAAVLPHQHIRHPCATCLWTDHPPAPCPPTCLPAFLCLPQLFETGVDEMSWDDLSQAREDWPSVREAHAYRAAAYQAVRAMLETTPCLDAPGGWGCPSWAVFMGFEHERIHIETSSVLIREVGVCGRGRGSPKGWCVEEGEQERQSKKAAANPLTTQACAAVSCSGRWCQFAVAMGRDTAHSTTCGTDHCCRLAGMLTSTSVAPSPPAARHSPSAPSCPQLPLAFVRKPEFWPEYHPTANSPSAPAPTPGVDHPVNPLLPVPGGTVVLGKPLDYPSFGFDNEYGQKVIQVAPFKASKYKVTNGEFHAFVKAGGYNTAALWSKEGWGWRTFRNVKWPTFWVPGEEAAAGCVGVGGGQGGSRWHGGCAGAQRGQERGRTRGADNVYLTSPRQQLWSSSC